MNSREAILGRVRESLRTNVGEAGRKAIVDKRLKQHPKGIIPAHEEGRKKILARFVEKAEAAAASVEVVKRDRVGKAVAGFLRAHNLPQRLRTGSDERLAAITWPEGARPDISHGPSDGKDEAGLSHAFAGVSETGTVLLLSGEDNPTTVNFLPENHIVIVDSADIAPDYESVWTRLRRKFGTGALPRTVNMITGPSRSADIEQTLIMGAHGPVRLHLIVVKD